jgi:hypothetical protein
LLNPPPPIPPAQVENRPEEARLPHSEGLGGLTEAPV